MKYFSFCLLFFVILPCQMVLANNSLSVIDNFSPGTTQINFVTVEQAKTIEKGKFSGLFFLESAFQSLAIYNSNDKGSDILNFLHVGLSYGLTDNLQIGFKGPMVINQIIDENQQSLILSDQGFANIEGFAKYQIFNETKYALSAMLQAGINNGDDILYVGPDSGPTFAASLLYERSFGKWLAAANLGYIFRSPGKRGTSFSFYEPIDSSISASLGASRAITKGTRLSIEVLMANNNFTKDMSDRDSFSSELLGSLHNQYKGLNLSYGVGFGLTKGLSTPTARGFLGLQYSFGFGRKVKKPKEQKPEASDLNVVKESPIEDDPIDENNETIIATEENEADTIDSVEVLKDEPPIVTNTPDKEEIVEVPVVVEEATNSSQESVNRLTVNDENTEALEDLKPSKTEIISFENINFYFDSYVITKDSYEILDKLLDHLNKQEFKTLEIWGHTDNLGENMYNEKLSLYRANAVYNYLIKKGISKEKMKFDGWGERKPVVPNTSAKNRYKNRRVEFIIKR